MAEYPYPAGRDTATGTDPNAKYEWPGFEDKSLGQAVNQDQELVERLLAESPDISTAEARFGVESAGAPALARQQGARAGSGASEPSMLDRLDSLGGGPFDPLVNPTTEAVDRALGATKLGPVLRGTWLGHPLHPALSDLPIGFWTSAVLLDLIDGRRNAAAVEALIGAGVLTAAPTALAGLADWSKLEELPAERVGLMHAALNVSALVCFAGSWRQRRRGSRASGRALSYLGSVAASAAGWIGGELAFGN